MSNELEQLLHDHAAFLDATVEPISMSEIVESGPGMVPAEEAQVSRPPKRRKCRGRRRGWYFPP